MITSGSPITFQAGLKGSNVLKRRKQVEDAPGVDMKVVISVPDTSSDEEDKITPSQSPQSAMVDDEDVVIPDMPEPSRGKLRNYSNRKPSQEISGKNLEKNFMIIMM